MTVKKPLVQALQGKSDCQIPLWMMRQAGRYLPEYKKLRAEAGDFLSLCYSPSLAAEVTLQPIRRFDFDAAILFSDILVVPDALGQRVWFVTGEGPKLEPLDQNDFSGLDIGKINSHLAPVFETVSRVKDGLEDNKALIGFCGAPWTVATYMVAGEGTKEQAPARLWAYQDEQAFSRLIDILTEASIIYLKGQIEAGVDVVQIFDSWAGSLAENEREKWCLEPLRKISRAIKEAHPEIPIIGFLRGAPLVYQEMAKIADIEGVGIDTASDIDFARETLSGKKTIQGNLDPLALLAGGDALDEGIDRILEGFGETAFIFNLGHGILPETPIAHVEYLVAKVRAYSKATRGA